MKSPRVKNPALAIAIVFIEAFVMYRYGLVEGSALIFGLLAAIIIYKIITNSPQQ